MVVRVAVVGTQVRGALRLGEWEMGAGTSAMRRGRAALPFIGVRVEWRRPSGATVSGGEGMLEWRQHTWEVAAATLGRASEER
jgi:hypothetical protein